MKVEKKYSIILPYVIEQNKLVNKLRDVIAYVDFEIIISDNTYTLKVSDKEEGIDNCIKVSVKNKGIYRFTSIETILIGEKTECNYIEEDTVDPLLSILLNTFEGILVIADYEVDGCYRCIGTHCGINYNVDSMDYKLIEMYINQTEDPLESIYLYKITIDNVEDILDIIK